MTDETSTPTTITLTISCPLCPNTKAFPLDVNAVRRWRDGETVATAFPGLSKEDRERLTTGICDDCWKEQFAEDQLAADEAEVFRERMNER